MLHRAVPVRKGSKIIVGFYSPEELSIDSVVYRLNEAETLAYITVDASGGHEPLRYRVNNSTWQTSSRFVVDTPGTYVIEVIDELDNKVQYTLSITDTFQDNTIDYTAVGTITSVTDNAVYDSGSNLFIIPTDILSFHFVDNGVDMTAQNIGSSWLYIDRVYGNLYNWFVIDPIRVGPNSFTSSDEWRVSTSDDWNTLFNYCISTDPGIDMTNIGRHLKSRRQTNSPLGAPWTTTVHPRYSDSLVEFGSRYGLDTFRLSLSAGGARSSTGAFANLGVGSLYWSTPEISETSATRYGTGKDNDNILVGSSNKKTGCYVKLVREATDDELLLPDGSLVDPYHQNNSAIKMAVKIGTQIWTENLTETQFRNGSYINGYAGQYTDLQWAAFTTHAMCRYNNESIYAYIISQVHVL